MRVAAYKKRKMNNKGMTLIEVLVAFAILSVAIVPLMFSFVFVAKHNAKARALQQTSIMAHTVIENCKAYSLREIEDKINDDSFMPDATDCILGSSAFSGTGEYYFDDVKVYENSAGTESSNQLYDLKMTITPYGTKQSIMRYDNMNAYTDAVFMADGTQSTGSPAKTAVELETEAYTQFAEKIAKLVKQDSIDNHGITEGVTISADDVKISLATGGENAGIFSMDRVIEINVEESGGYEYAYVTYKYTYNLNSYFKYEVNIDGTITEVSCDCNVADTDTEGIYTKKFEIYSNTGMGGAADGKLERLYFFFNPTYNVDGIKYASDKIVVKNSIDDKGFDLYLVKQKRSDMTDMEIVTAEPNYKPSVSITGDVSNKINVFHNLKENFGLTCTPGWNDTLMTGVGYQVTDFDASAGVDMLIPKEDKQLMYKVQVEVYDDEAYDSSTNTISGTVKASMDATFLNW